MSAALFLLWLLFNGRITLEIVVFGVLLSAGLYAFAIRVLGYPWRRELFYLKHAPMAVLYMLVLLWETLKAAAVVARLALTPSAQPEPVLVDFHSGLHRESLNVVLANSITLTPGTITVFQEGDHFVVHALRKEYARGIENSSFIRLLRRFPQ